MLKMAFLLIGPAAFRSRWYVLLVLGAALITLALLMIIGISERVSFVTVEALGLIFVLNGLLSFLPLLVPELDRKARILTLLKAIGLIIIGVLIIGYPFRTDIGIAVLFALAFLLDGAGRIATAVIVRFPRWRMGVFYGAVELMLAVLVITEWPLPREKNIIFCISLFLALSGWLLVRMSLMLRTLESEVAILNLPLFAGRGWYDNAPVLIDTGEEVKVENPLTVHVWTPVGSAEEPARRLLIDRYVAAVDKNGVISTGHAAMEMLPDVYISHYPKKELERSEQDFINSLRGTSENDLHGRFQPSYAWESDWWCDADVNIDFWNYNPRRLRAFWAGYRQDNTYNLTNRNCSVVVAAALNAALEGSLAGKTPWLRLIRLLINPDLWVAAMISNRANSATWTPGLVVDYARTMARIVEARDVSWTKRFRGFLRRFRPRVGQSSETPQEV